MNEPFAAAAVRDLEEPRLLATEQRLDVELALGRASELVAELEQLVRAHPFRERFIGQLALALHRSGRSSEALAQLAAARRRFAGELGLDVSPVLRELEGQILRHDPALEGAASTTRSAAPRGRARRRRLAALVAVACIAAIAVAVALAFNRGDRPAEPAARSAQLIEVGTGESVALTASSRVLAAGDRAVWLAQQSDALVLRVDRASATVVDRIQVHGVPVALALGDRSLWVATSQPGRLERLDLETDSVTQTIPLGVDPVALAFVSGRLWLADAADEALIEIDPGSGSALRTVSLTTRPSSLAVDRGTAWVASHDDGTVTQVDLPTGAVLATAAVGTGPSGVAVAGGAIWIANRLAGTIARLDPATMGVTGVIATGSEPSAIAAAGGLVWVANESSRTLSAIDPRRAVIDRRQQLGGAPVSLGAVDGRLWIAVEPVVDHRGGRLVLLKQGPVALDPAIEYEITPPQFHGLVYDTLVTFDHTGGSTGLAAGAQPRARGAVADRPGADVRVSPAPEHPLLGRPRPPRLRRQASIRAPLSRSLPGRACVRRDRRRRPLRPSGMRPRSGRRGRR